MGQYENILDFLQRYVHNHSKSLNGKPMAVWGAGGYGRLAYCALVELCLSCECFIDSSPEKIGQTLLGLPVREPYAVMNDQNTHFIIVAVAADEEIRSVLIEARSDNDSYLMMCSEMFAEQEAKHKASIADLPKTQLLAGYDKCPEEIPSEKPLLGKRYKNDGMRIVPLDGFQTKALGELEKWLSSGDISQKEKVSCLCGSEDFLVLSEKDRHGIAVDIVLCKECGLVMQNPRMTAEGCKLFHSKSFSDISFGKNAVAPEELFFWRKKDASPIIHEALSNYLIPGLRVLEIGCAAGSVVEYFSELGYETVGIDLDDRYISYGRSRGLELYCCDAESLLPRFKAGFDIIILEHVVEHFVDLGKEISAIKRLLKPGGFIYMGVPGIKGFNLEYHVFDFLDSLQLMHLYYWNKDTFMQTMSWFGLHAVTCNEYISAVLQVSEPVPVKAKTNYSGDIQQFLLHLEKNRLKLLKGIYKLGGINAFCKSGNNKISTQPNM